MDAMYFKVRHEGKVKTRVLYNVLGINQYGYKELLGMYFSKSEGAKFWMQVLTDLQNQGVEDILIACIDNLSGFAEAIQSIYPHTEVQTCIVHQIRNSLKYVSYKDYKVLTKDLKLIYSASSKEAGEMELLNFEEKWGDQEVMKKWTSLLQNWGLTVQQLAIHFGKRLKVDLL